MDAKALGTVPDDAIELQASASVGRVAVGHPVDVATGQLFDTHRDFALAGKFPLPFERYFSTALVERPGSMFGPGWSSPFESKVYRDLDGFRFVENDVVIFFDDRESLVESGGTAVNFGAFAEVFSRKNRLIVRKWSPNDDEVILYAFEPPEFGKSADLLSVTDQSGQGFDIHRNHLNQIERISQRREPRGYNIRYNTQGRASSVRVFYPHTFKDPKSGLLKSREQSHEILRLEYSENGLLTRVVNSNQDACSYEYDDSGYLIKEVNICQMTYKFSYDANRRCTLTTGQDGYGLASLKYDESGKVVWVTNAAGETTTYYCNDRGQITDEIDALGNKVSTDFDEYGRTLRTIDQLGNAIEYTYDQNGNRDSVTDSMGATVTLEYDSNHNVVAITDAAGHNWQYEYDNLNRLTRQSDPLSNSTKFRYSQHSDIVERVDALGNSIRFRWNSFGDMVKSTDPEHNETSYEYTKLGQISAITNPKGFRTKAKIDRLGRAKSVTLADGSRRKFKWNAYGQLTEFVDEMGTVTRWKYRACGVPAVIVRNDGSRIRFRWSDVPGRLLGAINEKKEEHTLEYDLAGRLIGETDFSGRKTSYELNPAGWIAASVNPAGARTVYQRNDRGVPVSIDRGEGQETTFEYDLRGFLVAASNGGALIQRQYDPAGRLILERQGEHEIYSKFDATGNRVERNCTNGVNTKFEWNENGQLTRLTRPAFRDLLFEYDECRYESARFVSNGVSIHQAVDERGRRLEQTVFDQNALRRISLARPQSKDARLRRRYKYDIAGNLTELMDTTWGLSEFTNDMLGRIVEETHSAAYSRKSDYDVAHNPTHVRTFRTAKSDSAQRTIDASRFDRGSVLVSRAGAEYRYDECGQLTQKREADGTTTEYSWNSHNQLERVALPNGEEWFYKYDAFSRRVEKIGPTGRTVVVWDGEVPLLERIYDNSGKLIRETQWDHMPGGFEPIGKLENGSAYYCCNDIAGNPRELLDDRGQIAWSVRTNSLGEVIDNASAVTGCPIRFEGQWYDDETELAYNRFRYYSTSDGRYISPDPLGLAGSLNPYAFVTNPFKQSDPLGLTGRCPKQVEYGDTDLSELAIAYRRDNNLRSARNVAVFEYVDGQGNRHTAVGASVRGRGHAERLVAAELRRMGVQDSQVTRVYSELEPCNAPGGYCKRFLQENYPNADVSYSFEYGDAASRTRGVQQLRDAVNGLF